MKGDEITRRFNHRFNKEGKERLLDAEIISRDEHRFEHEPLERTLTAFAAVTLREVMD